MGEIESFRIEKIFRPLCKELKLKERFLELKKIGSLRPIDIKYHKYTEIWEEIEKESRKPQIPRNLRSAIEKIYRDYEKLLKDLTDFVEWLQEFLHERMGRFFDAHFLNDLTGIVVRSLLLEKNMDFKLIIMDAFEELEREITRDQFDEFSFQFGYIKSRKYVTQKPGLEDLGKQIESLLAQIKPVIEQVEKIIEEDRIFDLEKSDRKRSEEIRVKKPENLSFEYDVFICHASEDKEPFVRKLAEKLSNKGLKVWYDEFELLLGDSLISKIDFGLNKSRYGVVVLSKHFFRKSWTKMELVLQHHNFDKFRA